MATRRSDINKRRQGVLAVALPWLRRFWLGLLGLVAFTWLCSWLVITGAGERAVRSVQEVTLQALADLGFRVEHIYVHGREHADGAFLLALLNAEKGDPLFGVSLEEARELIEQTEWVAHARVERRWPNVIDISLQERVPSALWQRGDELFLLDERGTVIKTDRLDRFAGLIVVTGQGSAEASPALLQLLAAEPAVRDDVLGAARYGQRRWDLQFKNGIFVKMPEDESLGFALSRLAVLKEQKDLFDLPDIKSIDLRFPDQFIVETKRGVARDYMDRIAPKPVMRGGIIGGGA